MNLQRFQRYLEINSNMTAAAASHSATFQECLDQFRIDGIALTDLIFAQTDDAVLEALLPFVYRYTDQLKKLSAVTQQLAGDMQTLACQQLIIGKAIEQLASVPPVTAGLN